MTRLTCCRTVRWTRLRVSFGRGVDMAVHEIRVDRSKTLGEEPATGHNRWHPDIPPIVRCEPGDEVVLETRDAFDGQMGPQATLETVAAPFMGTIGLSPGRAALARITAREQAALDRGGFVLPPSAASAVPADPAIAAEALRTIPPREQAGNVDIKQLAAGTRLFIPVDTPGALFSAGDAHFAQGDCETCGTAIEMTATLRVRFTVHSGEAQRKNIRDPRFSRTDYWVAPEYATPRRFYATTGMSVTADGEMRPAEATLAAR